MITILTPTYNRGYILDKAYESLVNQSDTDFEWLIIDDGSSDDTKVKVNGYIKDNKIKVSYFYKKNGGKHTALNFGVKKALGDLILILDSDDYLTSDAIYNVKKYFKKYEGNDKIAGMSFLRKIKNPVYLGKSFSECVANPIEFKYNNGFLSDMCEVFRKDVLLKYPFPVFAGERFLSEAIVWNEIAFKYDMAYIPLEIYCTEYLEDGLSKNWLKSVLKCPLGARANSLVFMDKRFKFSIRVKNCILFGIYSFIAKKKIVKESSMKFFSCLFYLPCLFVSVFLKFKYKKE